MNRDIPEVVADFMPLMQLESAHLDRIVGAVPGGAKNIQDIYPLAPLQEGILFHHLLNERGGDAYVLATVLSVDSRDQLEKLIAALQSVVSRHDVLRTAVLWEELPQPVQVVYRQASLPVREVVLEADQDALEQIHREWLDPQQQRLDLHQAPLMRRQVAADPLSEQGFVLLTLHHIVGDYLSRDVLISEVVTHLKGRVDALPEAIPYRNHVVQALAHTRAQDAEAFFRRKLGDVEEPTAPYELLDVHGDGSRIEEARQELAVSLSQRVRTQARRCGVSAETLFHAAWTLEVSHTSGREDVGLGTVLLGRLQGSAGAQRSLGMFINTLPLRLRRTGVTAQGLVEQTQRELVELLGYEQASLAMAQRCSAVAATAPLFTTLLNYRHNVAHHENRLASNDLQILEGEGRTNYPILLSVDDLDDGFTLTMEVDRSLSSSRMLGYALTAVQSLVEALESAPHSAALQLSILPASERQQLIERFNATQAAYPQKKLIQELFEEQVQRAPDAVAVVYEDQSLSYGELNARSNQLARFLR